MEIKLMSALGYSQKQFIQYKIKTENRVYKITGRAGKARTQGSQGHLILYLLFQLINNTFFQF